MLRSVPQNVGGEISNTAMTDTEPEDSESRSEHAQPPSPTLLPVAAAAAAAGKRFRVTSSNVGGTLASVTQAASEGKEAATDVYCEVAQRILSDGYLSLTEAAEMLGKKHTGRALEKLIGNLPLVAFALSLIHI